MTTFDEFREAVSAYRLPRVLLAALELDVCTAVGDQTWTIPDLARTLKVSERGLAILCRNLAMAGILLKKGAVYRNSRLGATALNANHPAYRGGYLDVIKSHWADWNRLPESVRSGLPIDHDVPDSPEWRRRFTWAMHHRTVEIAPAIAAQVPLGGGQDVVGPRRRPRYLCDGVSGQEPSVTRHRVRPRGGSGGGEGDRRDP